MARIPVRESRPRVLRAPSRRATVASIAGLAAAVALPRARAQAWPGGKPIRLVSTSAAGGGADVLARTFAEWLGRELGTQVVVDNRPGANGLIATQETARAQPDGLTLLITYTAATVANKLMMARPAVDPLDLAPIGRIGGGGGNLLVVNPELPVKSVQDLVALVKSKPELSYASWGIGSGGHLVMEYIKQQTGMQIAHVPYKSSGQIPPDVISGVMPVATIDSATPVPFIRQGRMRAIAALSQTRFPQLPDVPTLGEQGIPYIAQSWYGLFGPKALPKELVDRLNGLLNRWLATPEAVAYFEQRQNTPRPTPTTPAEFQRVIDGDLVSWKKLIDAAGLVPQ